MAAEKSNHLKKDKHDHSAHGHSHGHSHSHEGHSGHHHHNHADIKNRKILLIAVILTFVFMLVEFIGGLISNSLALLSDAGHMLSDSASLIMAYFAIFLSQKKADQFRTFGYKRIETITAFVNGITLIIISLLIIKEGIQRIFEPVEINSQQLITVASLGLLINIVIAVMLFKNSRENLNIKAAFLHVIGDLLGSVGAIVAGIIVSISGWLYIDPIISFFIAALIIISSGSLLKETFHLLMEGTPRHIKLASVEQMIMDSEGVTNVHDLHIWSLGDTKILLTGHIVISEISSSEKIIDKISRQLHDNFGIEHSTIQAETEKCQLGCN